MGIRGKSSPQLQKMEYGCQYHMGTKEDSGTHIQGQSPVDVVVLDGKREYEAPQHKGDHVVHVRMGHAVGRGDPKDGEEEERGHGGYGHRDCLGEPPLEHPEEHRKHVPGPILEPGDQEARRGA